MTDKQPLGKRLSGVSLIFACGTALFSDGYANGVISEVNTLLKRVYGDEVTNNNYPTIVSSVLFAGTVVGMLIFGYLSDKMGRKFGMMTATGIVAFFSLLSAASEGAHHSVGGTLAMLSACRFLLGIGVGAEYPCGSVSASEQTEQKSISKNAQHRWFALATNSMIDTGFVISAFVPLVLYWIFGPNHLRAVWRMSLGLGFIPAMLVFLWRLNMDEPESYKKSSMKNVKIPYMLVLRRYWPSLVAISATWFIYDFITYPFGIYSSTVVDNITGGSDAIPVVFGWNIIINLFYIPGTIGGAFVVDYLGPKYCMITGLMSQAVIGFIMSGLYEKLTSHVAAFAVVYGIFLSFGELGPGNCLGLLASKTSPTAVRGQFYGIAAAIGKIGAFVGTWAFPPMIEAFGGDKSVRGNTGPFWVGSGLAVFSALITLCFIRPLTHDGMAEEDEKFRQYLEAHGFDTSTMGLGSTGSVTAVEETTMDEKVDEISNV
ncbi:putative metabolite transporter [Lentinula raphanica]|uniref:Metabolite transporter n=1 Tax=Lentinula raphanica TaxID=153919 RepID=A0AA38UL45_9AGAR|nr:putative metabolite transporter [Lentinula raphanica]KAJ3759001.1 putative metabolite transporter [Lentinula raphanica]KAJ3775245.1 putative metabolite transporter [Lentinula raphanica]KAJ3829889.1 putative metabolite transporter [Lentinula raphanica]KAJ3844771.1 putative metabolite transporter [Lentinula raphanica]